MFLRCLRAELQKCRRSPVWLAFVLLPVFPGDRRIQLCNVVKL